MIEGILEFTAGVTYIECNQLEDEGDIREGLKALADEEGTVGWQEYQEKGGNNGRKTVETARLGKALSCT